MKTAILILGSGPNALDARRWNSPPFAEIVAINNAWAVRPDWTIHIHPEDFPADRRPLQDGLRRRRIMADDYVPAQNTYGGFVYAGGTMAFTAAYWALYALRPPVMAFLGCDMVYANTGATHFYGTGTADPLRADISLRSLAAKAARLEIVAASQGCALVNLSADDSVLPYPRMTIDALENAPTIAPRRFDPDGLADLMGQEASLDYFVPSGRYWLEEDRFDPVQIDRIDAGWRDLHLTGR